MGSPPPQDARKAFGIASPSAKRLAEKRCRGATPGDLDLETQLAVCGAMSKLR
ncbi:MAG: hypothetical protein V7K98_01450 [Nostoc sp.]|uniref:hypothetical protein n=1 Tax=Nostoc sp. TaxID=1180 RepID=UPI002FF62F97